MAVEKKRGFSFVKEALTVTGSLALLYSVLFFAFTKNQVTEIKKLYMGKCQFPGCTDPSGYVEVHHVVTQRYSFFNNNRRPDTPLNAVPLCAKHHVGHEKGGRAISEEAHTDAQWDPIHQDSYLIHLLLMGQFESIPKEIKAKIDRDFPGLYEYYNKAYRDARAKGKELTYNDLYGTVMVEWRKLRLKNRQIYWNDAHDSQLQIIAITKTRKALKDGWKYPLAMLGGNVKPENRGLYAWDNLVALSLHKYVMELTDEQLNTVFNEMTESGSKSRIVYLKRIYEPALANYKNKENAGSMINNYLRTLPVGDVAELLKKFDRDRNCDLAFDVLLNDFYLPALALHNSKQRPK